MRSQPGRGSVFSIRVPLAQEAPRRQVQSAAQPILGNPLPGRRLLVIDNEVDILHSMDALLGQWGCEVVTAVDLAEALQKLQGRAPEVILVDFHLDHGVLGCQVIQQLRDEFSRPIPALIISADRSDACRRDLQALGAPLLNKPVKPGKLRAVLSQLLIDA